MTCRPVKLLMKNLKRLIDMSNDYNPQVNRRLSELSSRHQLQLLYEELGSMIQILSVKRGNKPEQVRNLKTRFEYVAEEIQDMIDMSVGTDLNSKEAILYAIFRIFDSPVVVGDVMRSIKSIKEDYFSILNNKNIIKSSPTPSLKTQSAASRATSSRNSQVWDEIIVGLDRDLDIIRSKLAEDKRKLEIVSVVGMGGSGKTTLATCVFNDRFVCYHFKIRGWVTVSQTYEKTDLLNQILASVGVEIDLDKRDNYSHLREKLHKRLMGQRYLVVIDDIWSTGAWEDLKVVFPDHNSGSRLLLTTRNKNVALHAKSHGFVHQIGCLTDEECWELLHKKVFHGHDFPDWVTGPGMQIARNCRGLPLAVVVIAGVLAKEPLFKDSWERMETLALSVNHLPSHLRNCFLYLGGFPEDYKFQVTRLIWLWIAEGFIQESEYQSLEETAKDYLMELVDRNLVVVKGRKFDGAVKTVSFHDVLRELSSEIATKETFSMNVLGWKNCIIAPYKTSRLVIQFISPYAPLSFKSYFNLKCCRSWRLLTVLDLRRTSGNCFPEVISLLVNLSYLAIQNTGRHFQSAICDLRSLKTLIIERSSSYPLVLPDAVSNLVNLRHLQCQKIKLPPLEMPLMNLQTISNVDLLGPTTNWVNYFPGVKKLSCYHHGGRKYDLRSLTFLEILKIRGASSVISENKSSMFWFPASLKKLTLDGCFLPWSSMSSIQSLPNLEVLKLLACAFVGPQWDAGEEPFQQLKYLKLEGLDVTQWEAFAINFPCLKQLVLYRCHSLERIPPDMGYIPTLERIQIEDCKNSVIESAYKIQEEQHADGNYDLKVIALSNWSLLLDNIKIRTGISINLLTPHELKALGLPINYPRARSRVCMCVNRNSNDAIFKYHPIKRKILKGR